MGAHAATRCVVSREADRSALRGGALHLQTALRVGIMLPLRLQSAARYLLPSPLPEHLQRQSSRAEAQPARAQPAEEAKSTLPHGICSDAPSRVSRAPAGSASMRTT